MPIRHTLSEYFVELSCAYQCQRVKIYHCGRHRHERRVEAVEHSTMARQYVAAVFDAEGALEERLHEVAP